MRTLGAIVGAALAVSALAAPAAGQGARPLSLVVSFPAGTPPDIVARVLAPPLAEALKRPVVVDNRAGAGGNIGTDAVAKAAPDESVLLVSTNAALSTNKALYPALPYDPERDLDPVSLLVAAPLMLVVDPKLPIGSLAEFVAAARREPGRLSYATTGVGSAVHLTMEALKRREGIDVVHVPYRGSPAATNDILGGRIQTMWAIATGVLPLVAEGKLRAIAVSGARRMPAAPDVPTVGEQGYGELEGSAWFALMAPARTPPAHLALVHATVARTLGSGDVRAGLEKQGYEVLASDPAATRDFLRAETRKWTAVIEAAGIRATE